MMKQVQKTAKIYAFPEGGRASRRGPLAAQRANRDQPSYMPAVDFGSGWYHDAAIKDDNSGQ